MGARGVPGSGGKRIAMKARKRSELHIADGWLGVRWYMIIFEPWGVRCWR